MSSGHPSPEEAGGLIQTVHSVGFPMDTCRWLANGLPPITISLNGLIGTDKHLLDDFFLDD